MSAIRAVLIKCDVPSCRSQRVSTAGDIRQARAESRDAGWTVRHFAASSCSPAYREDRCPGHSE